MANPNEVPQLMDKYSLKDRLNKQNNNIIYKRRTRCTHHYIKQLQGIDLSLVYADFTVITMVKNTRCAI